MKVSIGISNHHVHVTEEDLKLLFGEDAILDELKPLKQIGQYASSLKVTVETEKGTIANLRILGPCRSYTQVELSKTDCYLLGIDAPVRTSGQLENAAPVRLVGPVGTITRACAIIADRHIHIDHKMREELGLLDITEVSVRVGSEKASVLEHVQLKEAEPSYFEMHLDTDDANACLLKQGDFGEIIL